MRGAGPPPALNARIDTEAGTATYFRDVHLGVAVDTEHGLVVPTIRSAQELEVTDLARRIAEVAFRARDQQLQPGDVTEGTFTITNTGSRGVLFDTPILHPPQVGILATTLIEKRPVVVIDESGNESLAIRQLSYLCLTYDHQLVDGADAARFLADLKHELETTEMLGAFAALSRTTGPASGINACDATGDHGHRAGARARDRRGRRARRRRPRAS